jgi:hypothetical protein
VCFHNLCKNSAASSSVSIAQETWWIPQPVQILWKNETPPASDGNHSFLCHPACDLVSVLTDLSQFLLWEGSTNGNTCIWGKEAMVGWTELKHIWPDPQAHFFLFFGHDESSGPEGHSWELWCYFDTHMSCSIVRVLQINAFSSSPAVTNRWPSGEKRHVRTPDPLTWKLGRPRRPLCNEMKMPLKTNTNQQGCKQFSKKIKEQPQNSSATEGWETKQVPFTTLKILVVWANWYLGFVHSC